jgi:ADYC domain
MKIWIAGLLVVSSACLIEPGPGSEPEEAVSVTTQMESQCPTWGCGENSPIMGPWKFYELNVNHLANAQGISIIDFQQAGHSYQPHLLNGSQLLATDAAGITISGAALAGGYFRLATPSGPYNLLLSKVSPLATSAVLFWIGPPSPIETYELVYMGPTDTFPRPVCNSPPSSTFSEGPRQSWARPLEAILYTGDRYDADQKLVTASSYPATLGWFNIACAGSALAKLHLTRHTTAGSTPAYLATASQRQAMLKMYVSDVCGNGDAWTKKGTPLHWTNTLQWNQLDNLEFAQEALWTATGARCLTKHRLGALYDNFAGFRSACNPPPCPVVPYGAPLPLGAYLLSAVPFDPGS